VLLPLACVTLAFQIIVPVGAGTQFDPVIVSVMDQKPVKLNAGAAGGGALLPPPPPQLTNKLVNNNNTIITIATIPLFMS
jgi:hypothetical protein